MRHVQPLNQKRNITIEMKESFPPKIHLTKLTNKKRKDKNSMEHSFNISIKGILSTSCVIFSYPKLLSISVLTFIK